MLITSDLVGGFLRSDDDKNETFTQGCFGSQICVDQGHGSAGHGSAETKEEENEGGTGQSSRGELEIGETATDDSGTGIVPRMSVTMRR